MDAVCELLCGIQMQGGEIHGFSWGKFDWKYSSTCVIWDDSIISIIFVLNLQDDVLYLTTNL
jgi:hypothetical protein